MVKNKHLLDTPSSELAYWIGYISADGSIKKDGYKLSFCINSKDSILLEKFVEYFDVTNPIRHREVFDKRTQKTYSQTNLQVTDVEFIKKLSQYGLTSQKSEFFTIPDCFLNEEFFFDFLRGLLDGDGYISVIGNSQRIGFMGTRESMLQIQEYLSVFYCFSGNMFKYECSSKSCNLYKLSYYSDAIKIMRLMYRKEHGLERKYSKYLETEKVELFKLKNSTSKKRTREVFIYNDNNILVNYFPSVAEAAVFLKIPSSTLSNIIAGRHTNNKNLKFVLGDFIKSKTLRNNETIYY